MSAPDTDLAPALSVIAPCLNEEENVALLVRRSLAVFDQMAVEAEILLVDDGSDDDTWSHIEREMERDGRVRGSRHEVNQGIEGSWRTALGMARGDLICLIDSDLQNRPEDIPRLYDAYRSEKPDVVQAVRHPKGIHNRHLFSLALNLLLNVSFGMNLRDNKSGFVLCRREVLEDILTHRYRYRYFQSFIGVAAGVRRYGIVQIDTDFEARHSGESFLSSFPIGVSLRICFELLKYRSETWRLGLSSRSGRKG